MHSCMIFSVSIFSLNSSPMNWMLPSIRRRAFRSSCVATNNDSEQMYHSQLVVA